MPALVARVHVLKPLNKKDVDGRDEPGHDGGEPNNAAIRAMSAWMRGSAKGRPRYSRRRPYFRSKTQARSLCRHLLVLLRSRNHCLRVRRQIVLISAARIVWRGRRLRRVGGLAVGRRGRRIRRGRRRGRVGCGAEDPRAGGFLGANVREHHETVRCVVFGQAGAGADDGFGRYNGRPVDHVFEDDPAAVAEHPVCEVTVAVSPPTRMAREARMAGKYWMQRTAGTHGGAESSERGSSAAEAAAAEAAAAKEATAATTEAGATTTTAKATGIRRGGNKAGSGNRGRGCESKDDFA